MLQSYSISQQALAVSTEVRLSISYQTLVVATEAWHSISYQALVVSTEAAERLCTLFYEFILSLGSIH